MDQARSCFGCHMIPWQKGDGEILAFTSQRVESKRSLESFSRLENFVFSNTRAIAKKTDTRSWAIRKLCPFLRCYHL
jgi:hypothetical protein